jgi:hypothetical protein
VDDGARAASGTVRGLTARPTESFDVLLIGRGDAVAQNTGFPYISPSGSLMSSMRAPSGSRK